MAELENSKRILLQATYTPIKAQKKYTEKLKRAWEKWSFVASLKPRREELMLLKRKFRNNKVISKSIEIIISTIPQVGTPKVLSIVPFFRDIEPGTLIHLAEALIKIREQKVSSAKNQRRSNGMATREPQSPRGSWAIDNMRNLLEGFKQRLEVEPVGFLHLERTEFTPAGIEPGELVYSVPLTPKEEVNITHKEWSNTSEEFEKIVTDYMEGFSEEGVTEKSELTQATNSQEQHSSGFNTGVTASGGYGPVKITASAGYNAVDSASRSEQFSRNSSAEITRKASTRTKKEHKISFKIASAAGTEDQTVRKIINPFEDKATRVDYYQLVRKWKVDLYRYGVRLTYDINIPEPGSDIISKIKEINNINDMLEQGFNFPLQPEAITRSEYSSYASKYNAVIEPPPDESKMIQQPATHDWSSYDESKNGFVYSLDIDVGDDYKVDSAKAACDYMGWSGHDPERRLYVWYATNPMPTGYTEPHNYFSLPTLKGLSGKITILYQGKALKSLGILVEMSLALKDEAFRAWQMKAWGIMRDAAQAQYYEDRQMLKEKMTRLTEELGAQDALSLRKIEREEVMKGVLRWLFGPTFEFAPSDMPEDLYNENEVVIDEVLWGTVLYQGEIIKFLHNAIEWENMIYFLYPYFWSHKSRWELKKYLDHPDFMHRAFLKSGSARVVLTIRPGFEEAFTALLEEGSYFDALNIDHPYVSISKEMENYANTNYPGIRTANPIDDARPLIFPKQRKAWEEMQLLIKLINAYFEKNGVYPTNLPDVQDIVPYNDGVNPPITEVPFKDPWDHNYVYTFPGLYGNYDLVSYGADGAPGGDDENADITSWAEASLIGTWNEYTPTSAMDIRFNADLPNA